MKKNIIIICVVISAAFAACKSETELGKCVGFANGEERNRAAVYDISVRNALWTIVAFETVIVPVLYFMYYVKCPVGVWKWK